MNAFRKGQEYRPLGPAGGFTLIEILVSVLVISLGVLGLIAQESLSLRNNLTAYFRSQATLLAYGLSDKMRANPSGIVSNAYVNAVSNANASLTLPATTCRYYSGTVGAGCTSAQVAAQDAFDWVSDITRVLPMGQGTLVNNSGLQQITISWDEDRDGVRELSFIFGFDT